MLDTIEEEVLIRNRLIFKESSVKKLASKYIELTAKISQKSETSSQERKQELLISIKEIITELDNIEILALKAENYEKLKERDINHHNSSCKSIENETKLISSEIESLNNELIKAKEEKDFKNSCEEIALVINSYSSKDELNNQILSLENENQRMIQSQNSIMTKIGNQSKKLSLLVNIVNDLRDSFSN